jgi:hypothetical protein
VAVDERGRSRVDVGTDAHGRRRRRQRPSRGIGRGLRLLVAAMEELGVRMLRLGQGEEVLALERRARVESLLCVVEAGHRCLLPAPQTLDSLPARPVWLSSPALLVEGLWGLAGRHVLLVAVGRGRGGLEEVALDVVVGPPSPGRVRPARARPGGSGRDEGCRCVDGLVGVRRRAGVVARAGARGVWVARLGRVGVRQRGVGERPRAGVVGRERVPDEIAGGAGLVALAGGGGPEHGFREVREMGEQAQRRGHTMSSGQIGTGHASGWTPSAWLG